MRTPIFTVSLLGFLCCSAATGSALTQTQYAGAVGVTNNFNDGANPLDAVGSDESACAFRYSDTQAHNGFWNGFGFSIPAGATIDGILVEYKRSWSTDPPTAGGPKVTIGKDEITLGTPKDDFPLPSGGCGPAQPVGTLGGPTDLWGMSWTAAEINSPDFATRFYHGNYPQEFGWHINWIRVTVYYTVAAPETILDDFNAISYSGNDGTRPWSGPWVEVGDDGTVTGGNIFVESHAQNPTPDTLALKIQVASTGQYVYREANLLGATSATLTYDYHNEITGAGQLDLQVSGNGGGNWTTLKTYSAADVFGSETIDITSNVAADTQIRFISTALGGKHFRVDTIQIAYVTDNGPPTVVSAIPDTTVRENSAPINDYRDLNDVFTDMEDGGALTFVMQSNDNPGLVTPSIDGADSTLDLSFAAGQSGSATIVIRATDSGALFVEDTFFITVTPTYDMSGRVFEDAVITAGVGEPFNVGEGDTGTSGARVELFDASDVFQSFATTDGSGNYTFANLDGGTNYKVRVVAATLDAGVGALPEQTFESDGFTDYGTFGGAMGGQDALAADTAGQSTMTGAEHWVVVAVGAADVTGVDFGFSYELVVNTNDTGQGSFRRFLENANGITGVQTSRFNIPATDPSYTASPLAYAIQPPSPLPEITDPTIVDGTTQPDFAAAPIIVLDGAQAGAGASGLRISAGSSTVRGLVVNQFTSSGIHVTTAGSNTIEGNYIGTDVTGLLDHGNGAHGIHIESDTGGNKIGGVTVTARNVISGNGANGIFLQASSNNNVQGCYIGADKNGTPSLGNAGHGIRIDAGDNNVIGGTAPGEGNLISDNAGSGVSVTG